MLKSKKIVFISHPHMKGYAKLDNLEQAPYVRKLGGSVQVNSEEFEKFQEKAAKEGVQVYWIS